ncbi:12996_t:CDS:2, partial [Gigaspora margarita]
AKKAEKIIKITEEAGDLRAMGQDDNRLKKAVEANEEYRQKLESAEAHVKKLVDQLDVHMTITERDNSRLKEERDGLKKKLEACMIENADRLMKDQEIDNLNNLTDKLRKSEDVIVKYRKKLEETADIRRTLKALEQENRQLVERNQMIEDEYRKAIRLLGDRARKLELEDRVREMELGDDDDKTEVKEYTSIGDEISHASKGSSITSLRIKVFELKRELTKLREGKPADGNACGMDSNRAKVKLEKNPNEKLLLESELRLQQSGSNSNG